MNQEAYDYQIWYLTSLSKGLLNAHMKLTLTYFWGHSDLWYKFSFDLLDLINQWAYGYQIWYLISLGKAV